VAAEPEHELRPDRTPTSFFVRSIDLKKLLLHVSNRKPA
jgi:hypothetical protein